MHACMHARKSCAQALRTTGAPPVARPAPAPSADSLSRSSLSRQTKYTLGDTKRATRAHTDANFFLLELLCVEYIFLGTHVTARRHVYPGHQSKLAIARSAS